MRILHGIIFCITMPVGIAAQQVVSGVVRDTSGAPIDSAEVIITGQGHAFTNAAGHYRVNGVKPGTWVIRARHIGYLAAMGDVTVKAGENAEINFELVRFAQTLKAVVSLAQAGGLAGIVADTAFKRIAGVEVRAMGKDKVTTTDSLGQFFLDLRAGAYSISFRKAEFDMRMLGVSIPPDSGRQVMMWLSPRTVSTRKERDAVEGLATRMILMSAQWGKIWTRQEILDSKVKELRLLVGRTAVGDLTECLASIQPQDEVEYLGDIDPTDVEMMEVQTRTPELPGLKIGRSRGRPRAALLPPMGCPSIRIWLKT